MTPATFLRKHKLLLEKSAKIRSEVSKLEKSITEKYAFFKPGMVYEYDGPLNFWGENPRLLIKSNTPVINLYGELEIITTGWLLSPRGKVKYFTQICVLKPKQKTKNFRMSRNQKHQTVDSYGKPQSK